MPYRRNTALREGKPCLTAGEHGEPAVMTATLTGLRRCPTTAALPAAARPYGERCLLPQARHTHLRLSIIGNFAALYPPAVSAAGQRTFACFLISFWSWRNWLGFGCFPRILVKICGAMDIVTIFSTPNNNINPTPLNQSIIFTHISWYKVICSRSLMSGITWSIST